MGVKKAINTIAILNKYKSMIANNLKLQVEDVTNAFETATDALKFYGRHLGEDMNDWDSKGKWDVNE